MKLTMYGLKTFLEVGDKRTVILNSEDADILIDLLLDSDTYFENEEWEIIECLEESDVVAITKDEYETYWLEDALGYSGKVKSFDTYILVEEDALSPFQIKSITDDFDIFNILYDDIVNDDNYEEEICERCDSDEEDEIAFAIEEVVEDTLIELEDSECEWCSVEKAVRRGYSVGYANALRMMRDAIDEILEED